MAIEVKSGFKLRDNKKAEKILKCKIYYTSLHLLH